MPGDPPDAAIGRHWSPGLVWRYGVMRTLVMGVLALFLLVPMTVLGMAFFSTHDQVGRIALVLVGLVGELLLAIVWGHFLAALRFRITLDGAEIRLVVPTWRGVYPFPPFNTVQLSTRQVAVLEVRDEAAEGLGMTMIARVVALVTTTGERIIIA